MNFYPKDLSADKIKLIYEFNHSSPLFARVAASELEKGNYNSAFEILENGMEIHPDYPSAYFVHAIACAYLGKVDEARSSVNKAVELLGTNEFLEFYHNKVDSILKELKGSYETKRPAFIEEPPADITAKEENKNSEDLGALAEQLNGAKIPRPMGTENDFEALEIPSFEGTKLVSETLAEIYFNQGNLKESQKIYRELLLKKTDRSEFYAAKIAEIEAIINKG